MSKPPEQERTFIAKNGRELAWPLLSLAILAINRLRELRRVREMKGFLIDKEPFVLEKLRGKIPYEELLNSSLWNEAEELELEYYQLAQVKTLDEFVTYLWLEFSKENF